jgi:hypothetical protein
LTSFKNNFGNFIRFYYQEVHGVKGFLIQRQWKKPVYKRRRCSTGTPGAGLNILDSEVQKHIMTSLMAGSKAQKVERKNTGAVNTGASFLPVRPWKYLIVIINVALTLFCSRGW